MTFVSPTVLVVPNYSDWGRRVREARQARGWKQSDLAERAGVTQQTISWLEAGLGSPTDATRQAVAVALDVRVEDLFPYSSEPVAG